MRPIVLASTAHLADHTAFVTTRNQYGRIGSSDAAAVCNLDPWTPPLRPWLRLIGEPLSQEETDAMLTGTLLEDDVATIFSYKTGFPTKRRNAILQHAEHVFMTANLDRLTKDDTGHWVPLELKTASAWKAEAWADGAVPEHYQLQVQHQLAVTDADHGWICVLIGGQIPRWSRIDRDDALIANLIDLEADFWYNHVLTRIPPVVDGREATTEVLKRLYPEATTGHHVILDAEAVEQIRRKQALADQIDQLTQDYEAIRNAFRVKLGDAEAGYVLGVAKPVVTWKSSTRNHFDEKAFAAAYPALYQEFTHATPARTLRFPPLKEVHA